MRKTLLVSGLVLVMTAAALAVPSQITYQGRLTDAAGQPLASDTVTVKFDIYAAITGGAILATATQQVSTDAQGVFTAELGGLSAAFDGSTRYVALTVRGTLLAPRQRLTTAPYAFRADYEAGVTQGIGKTANVNIPSTNTAMIDVVTTTITTPAPGYIVVIFNGQLGLYGTTAGNYVYGQIDETAGGSYDLNYQYNMGPSQLAGTGTEWWPVTMSRTYFKNAGTYTFRFEAMPGSANGSKYFWNPVITAMYFPTSYGTVSTVMSAGDAQNFETAEPFTVTSQESGQQLPESAYKVDLSELERKSAGVSESSQER